MLSRLVSDYVVQAQHNLLAPEGACILRVLVFDSVVATVTRFGLCSCFDTRSLEFVRCITFHAVLDAYLAILVSFRHLGIPIVATLCWPLSLMVGCDCSRLMWMH